MPIETASYISELVATNPPGNEPVGEGDNHLRLIKDVLKKTFTGGASGLAGPVTVTHTELNRLAGITSNIQSSITTLNGIAYTQGLQITALETARDLALENFYAPAGTSMLFYQNAAPAGWVVNTASANRMVIISPVGGGFTGGTNDPLSITLNHAHTTGNFTLTTAHIPAHTHLSYYNTDSGLGGGAGSVLSVSGVSGSNGSAATSSVGSDAAHNHGATSSSLNNWEPRYLVCLRCTKA
jgi:hypothetical protein